MKLSEAFPSNFLKAEDLGGKPVTLTIEAIDFDEIGQGRDKEKKLIITFRKTDKKLICNKTNATTIGKLYGEDTDAWVGQRITIMPREVEYQGEMVWSIRVSLQKPAATATKPVEPEPEPAGDTDDVPF